MNGAYSVITTTVPTLEDVKTITDALLEQRLAACIQSHRVSSSYIWEGKITVSDELLLQIKTKTARFESVKTVIESLHPYEVPEIILTHIHDANLAYLKWIDACVTK